jgi:hypothetical protein
MAWAAVSVVRAHLHRRHEGVLVGDLPSQQLYQQHTKAPHICLAIIYLVPEYIRETQHVNTGQETTTPVMQHQGYASGHRWA